MASQQCCGGTFWLYILIICGLVLFAGMMSGLTLGLMSLGLVDLEVLMKSGTAADRKHAGVHPHVRLRKFELQHVGAPYLTFGGISV